MVHQLVSSRGRAIREHTKQVFEASLPSNAFLKGGGGRKSLNHRYRVHFVGQSLSNIQRRFEVWMLLPQACFWTVLGVSWLKSKKVSTLSSVQTLDLAGK